MANEIKTTQPCPLRVTGGSWTTQWWEFGDHLRGGKYRHTKKFGPLSKVPQKVARARYHNWLVQWQTDQSVRLAKEQEAITIRELAERYNTYAKDYYRNRDGSPNGPEAVNVSYAIQTVVDLFGDLAAKDFGPKHLEQVQQALIQEKIVRTSINARLGRIRRVFRWAAKKELVSISVIGTLGLVDPLKKGRCGAEEADPVKSVPTEHVDATLVHLPDTVADMIRLQLLTGMRPDELCMMRVGDIDITGEAWEYRPQWHKNLWRGKDRSIFLGPLCIKIVKKYLSPDFSAYLFTPRRAMQERWAKCPNHRSKDREPNPKKTSRKLRDHYTTNSYGQAIRRICVRFDIPEWSPNQLRHSRATWLRKEYGLEAAAVILGHSRVETTQIYAEINRDRAKEIMLKVG